MATILQKRSFNRKKTVLTGILLVLGWFVHAGGYRDDFNFDEVKQVKFYPNPASSYINFEFPNDIDKTYYLEIYSFTGRKITELPVSANKLTLTLNNDYYRGIYVFHLREKSGKVIEAGKFQVVK